MKILSLIKNKIEDFWEKILLKYFDPLPEKIQKNVYYTVCYSFLFLMSFIIILLKRYFWK